MADLFDRAKGPRAKAKLDWWNFWEVITCPWCKADVRDAERHVHHRVMSDWWTIECPKCRKEMLLPDPDGKEFTVGMLSPADMKYLAARAAQGDGARTESCASGLLPQSEGV